MRGPNRCILPQHPKEALQLHYHNGREEDPAIQQVDHKSLVCQALISGMYVKQQERGPNLRQGCKP